MVKNFFTKDTPLICNNFIEVVLKLIREILEF